MLALVARLVSTSIVSNSTGPSLGCSPVHVSSVVPPHCAIPSHSSHSRGVGRTRPPLATAVPRSGPQVAAHVATFCHSLRCSHGAIGGDIGAPWFLHIVAMCVSMASQTRRAHRKHFPTAQSPLHTLMPLQTAQKPYDAIANAY